MAKDDQQEAYEKLLSATLPRAVDFVKFAETKNAALRPDNHYLSPSEIERLRTGAPILSIK
jgi:hypothetical protein